MNKITEFIINQSEKIYNNKNINDFVNEVINDTTGKISKKREKKNITITQLNGLLNILNFTEKVGKVMEYINKKIERNKYKEFYEKLKNLYQETVERNSEVRNFIIQNNLERDKIIFLLAKQFFTYILIDLIYNLKLSEDKDKETKEKEKTFSHNSKKTKGIKIVGKKIIKN